MRTHILIIAVLFIGSWFTYADTVGSGDNQFDIDFVSISAETNPESSPGILTEDYRISKYEITNSQWDAYVAATEGESNSNWPGDEIPTTKVSWFEAARFVNWLNITTGNHVAYKFIEDSFTPWDPQEPGYDPNNPYRHKEAYYFLPTENEWFKAAYWNGSNTQLFASQNDTTPVAGTETNYANAIGSPWTVATGSEEINGTFNIMGNVWEWLESPQTDNDFSVDAHRGIRGGAYINPENPLKSTNSNYHYAPDVEYSHIGIRVASKDEPICPTADLSGDCFVDLEDLAILVSQWMTGERMQ